MSAEERIDNLVDYGFTEKEALYLVEKFPPLLGCTAERTNSLLENLETYGFTRTEVQSLVKKLPPLLGCTAERTNGLLVNLETYGFTRTEVRSLVKKLPSLLGYTAERTNGLLVNLETYGFTRTEVRSLVKKLPSLLGYTAERTNRGLRVLSGVNLDPLNNYRLLIYSPELLAARCKFLASLSQRPTVRELNLSNKAFENKFGISKKELLKLD